MSSANCAGGLLSSWYPHTASPVGTANPTANIHRDILRFGTPMLVAVVVFNATASPPGWSVARCFRAARRAARSGLVMAAGRIGAAVAVLLFEINNTTRRLQDIANGGPVREQERIIGEEWHIHRSMMIV
jgi:hypothetical protein